MGPTLIKAPPASSHYKCRRINPSPRNHENPLSVVSPPGFERLDEKPEAREIRLLPLFFLKLQKWVGSHRGKCPITETPLFLLTKKRSRPSVPSDFLIPSTKRLL